MLVAGFLVLVGLLVWYELPRIRRYGGGRREVIAFWVLMGLAVAMGVAIILQLPVPNSAKAIEAMFRPLGEKVLGLR